MTVWYLDWRGNVTQDHICTFDKNGYAVLGIYKDYPSAFDVQTKYKDLSGRIYHVRPLSISVGLPDIENLELEIARLEYNTQQLKEKLSRLKSAS